MKLWGALDEQNRHLYFVPSRKDVRSRGHWFRAHQCHTDAVVQGCSYRSLLRCWQTAMLWMGYCFFFFEFIYLEIFHASTNRPWLLNLCAYLLLNRQIYLQVCPFINVPSFSFLWLVFKKMVPYSIQKFSVRLTDCSFCSFLLQWAQMWILFDQKQLPPWKCLFSTRLFSTITLPLFDPV